MISTSRRDVTIIFLKVRENKSSFQDGPSHLCNPEKDQALVSVAYDAHLSESPKEGLNW